MNNQIIQYINKTHGCKLSGEYYTHIDMWRSWWQGFHEPFHRITFENGEKRKSRDMYTMKMAKKVCEDWAAILINDKTFVKIDDDYSQRFVAGDTDNGGVFGSNNFWEQANSLMENMMWSGTAAVIIRIKNLNKKKNGDIRPSLDAHIDLNYVSADKVIPITVDNGTITEAAFCSDVCVRGENKIYLEIHRLENGEYIIENHVFNADKNGSYIIREDDLPENTPRVIHTGSNVPWFSICTPAVVNTAENSSGLGCAVFANAIDNLKGVDLAYNNFNSDIWLGQKKVFLNKNLMADVMGEKVTPDEVNQQLFYYIRTAAEDGEKPLVQEHNPDLRVADNTAAVQAQLDYLSFKVGFGTKHYQFNAGSIVTATQYTGDKQDLIQNAHKHFIKVETFLHRLVKSILWIGHSFIDAAVKPDAHISVVFDQSPLIDETAERLRDSQDVASGIMAKWEYRMKWYGESEEQAKSAIAEIEGSQSDDELLGFGDA